MGEVVRGEMRWWREAACLATAGSTSAVVAHQALVGLTSRWLLLPLLAAGQALLAAAWLTARPTGGRQLERARLLAGAASGLSLVVAIIQVQARWDTDSGLNAGTGTSSLLLDPLVAVIPALAPLALIVPTALVLAAGWRHPDAPPRRRTDIGSPEWASALIQELLPDHRAAMAPRAAAGGGGGGGPADRRRGPRR